MISFLVKLIKFSLWLIVIVISLILVLNYASYFYRYPVFKWLTSSIEDQFVVEKIEEIQINPSGFSNTITLKGLNLYNKEVGDEFSIEINQIEARIDLISLWKNRVLFETISINNSTFNLETFLALLINDPQYQELEIYKNLEIYLTNSELKQNQLESEQSQRDMIKNLALKKQWIKAISSRIELVDSKILFGNNAVELKSAEINLLDKTTELEAKLFFNQAKPLEINLVLNNESSTIFFDANQIPVSDIVKTLKNPDLAFLEKGFIANMTGFFDYKNRLVELSEFNLTSPIIQIKSSAKYQHKNNRQLEIVANITEPIRANQFIQLMPKSFFNKGLNNWLQVAFEQGEISKTQFVFDASLNEINQIKNKQLFEFNIEAQNLSLNFHPDWQAIKNLKTDIKLTNLAIAIDTVSNETKAKQIKIDADIESFHQNPELLVQIQIDSEQDFIQEFITQSPLKNNPKLTPILNFALNGQAKSEINLKIPFIKGKEIEFFGEVELIDNSLLINDWLKVEQINGQISFDAGNVSSRFKASWWQNPIEVNLYNSNENQLKIDYVLDLITDSSLDNLSHYLELDNASLINQIKKSISGNSQIIGHILASNRTANLTNPNSIELTQSNNLVENSLSNFDLTIQMASSLNTISLDWLPPFQKAKHQNSPFNLELTYADNQLKLQTLQFNEQIKMNRINELDSEWMDISMIDLNLQSKKIAELLEHLPKKTREQKLNQKPLHLLNLPDANLTIYRLRYDDRDMGSLSASFKIDDNQALIENIKLNTSTIKLTGHIHSDSLKTKLHFKNEATNPLADYFQYFNKKPITNSANSQVDLNLSWPGQIWDFEIKETKGLMEIKTDSGILLTGAQSSFIPRLIKELSVNSIRDRLLNILAFRKIIESIDPTTVFEEGIEFDNLEIGLSFDDNKIYTNKVNFNSEAINISVSGYTDLNDLSLHHSAIASPDFFKALPLIGLFTSNLPVALLGILSEKFVDTKNLVKVRYQISGDTNQPIVKLADEPL